ncbi:MAG: HigA family addiction module antidote protein [Rubrivivax sp.]|nr:HigA family addiction module antidote protein [Rubrivivax sp.]
MIRLGDLAGTHRGARGAAAAAPPAGVPMRRPPHPGRFLERHYLAPLALSQVEAARRLGISRRRLNELVQGHRGMTPDTAIRCTLLFGWPVDKWLAMQSGWDSYQAWRAVRPSVQAVGLLPAAVAGRASAARTP